MHTGVLTCFLISAARPEFSPCFWKGAGVHEHRGVLHLLGAGGHVDQVHLAIQGLGDLHAGLDAVASRAPLGPGDAHVDGEGPAHGGADLLHHQQGKRIRFSKLPPQRSVRWLVSSEMNWWSSQPWPMWIITMSKPQALAVAAAWPNLSAMS